MTWDLPGQHGTGEKDRDTLGDFFSLSKHTPSCVVNFNGPALLPKDGTHAVPSREVERDSGEQSAFKQSEQESQSQELTKVGDQAH